MHAISSRDEYWGFLDVVGGLVGIAPGCGQAVKSLNHEEHEGHEGHEELTGVSLALGGVVPAQAGTQGASGRFWIPACAGMTRSAKCLVTTALTEPPIYPDIRPQDISHPQQSPLHELHALHG